MRKVYCEIDFSLIYSAEQPDIEEFLFLILRSNPLLNYNQGLLPYTFIFVKTEPGTFPFYNIVFHNI